MGLPELKERNAGPVVCFSEFGAYITHNAI